MSEVSSAPLRLLPTTPQGRSIAATLAVALLVFADVRLGGLKFAEVSLAGTFAVALIAVGVRYPGVSLCVMFFFVPLQLTIVAFLYKHGLPAPLAKDLGYVKDATVLSIAIAALVGPHAAHSRHASARSRSALHAETHSDPSHRSRGRTTVHHRAHGFDVLDVCAAVYVGIASVYFLLPMLVPSALGGQPLQIRLNAWRVDCLFVVLLIAARRVQFTPRALKAARNTVVIVGVILMIVGVWESINADAYNHFLQSTIQLPKYQVQVLKVSPPPNANYVISSDVAGDQLQRVGSLMANSLEFAFFMLIPLGLCVERLGIRRPSGMALVGLGSGIAGVVLAETRSAMLGAGLAVLLAVRLAFRNNSPGRYRLAVLLALAAVIAVPVAADSVFQHRLFSSFSLSANQDTADHTSSSWNSLLDVTEHPQGAGLGTNPATGERFGTSNLTVSENSYLQVGTELGVGAMITFIAMYVALQARLRRETRGRGEQSSLAGGVWLAGWALFVCGFFLHVWTQFSVSLVFWGLAGAAIGPPARLDANHARAT